MVEHAPPSPAAKRAGHEVSSAHVRTLWMIAGGLLAMLAAVLAGLLVFRAIADPDRAPDTAARPMPPSPRLQAAPIADFEAYHAREVARLTSFGWIDRNAGVARIPIEAAMTIVAERGLPDFGPPPASEPDPGSGSGSGPGSGPGGPMPGAAAQPVPRSGIDVPALPRPERAVDTGPDRPPAPVEEPMPLTGERRLPEPQEDIPARARPTERRIIDLREDEVP